MLRTEEENKITGDDVVGVVTVEAVVVGDVGSVSVGVVIIGKLQVMLISCNHCTSFVAISSQNNTPSTSYLT